MERDVFKVLVIGDRCVGKSSIISRYVHKRFNDQYKATIGVDFSMKTIEWDNRAVVRLQFWDIAGQERFRNMSRVFYKEAMGAFVVFDMTRDITLESVKVWKRDLDSKVSLPSGGPIPAVLLANKCDQTERDMEKNLSMDRFCTEEGFLGWFETSAKDNINIDEAGSFLVEHILLSDQGLSSEGKHGGRIRLSQTAKTAENQSPCC